MVSEGGQQLTTPPQPQPTGNTLKREIMRGYKHYNFKIVTDGQTFYVSKYTPKAKRLLWSERMSVTEFNKWNSEQADPFKF